MNLTDKEIYDFLIISNRYAKTRNNHLQPEYTFNKTIELLNKWENKEEKLLTANQILTELSLDAYFINRAIENGQQTVGMKDTLKNLYCTYAKKLGNIIDPKAQNEEVQNQINKLTKELNPEEKIK